MTTNSFSRDEQINAIGVGCLVVFLFSSACGEPAFRVVVQTLALIGLTGAMLHAMWTGSSASGTKRPTPRDDDQDGG